LFSLYRIFIGSSSTNTSPENSNDKAVVELSLWVVWWLGGAGVWGGVGGAGGAALKIGWCGLAAGHCAL